MAKSHYRPITVSSVITRTLHKILAKRKTKYVHLDSRQRAFIPSDGCSRNIFDLDIVLRHHRTQFKPLYMAPMDIAKAFDMVSHDTILAAFTNAGIPEEMIFGK